MPVTVKKSGDKYRVVESKSGKVAKNSYGSAADGGGHQSKKKATAQARAINANK